MSELSWFAPNVRAVHKIAVGKKNDRYERERKKETQREVLMMCKQFQI